MLELMELAAGGTVAVAKGDLVNVEAFGVLHRARVCRWVAGHVLVDVGDGDFKALVYPDAIVEVVRRAAA
ncbi:hypothetical protein SAMN06265338_103198 [Rhodoblastus acidophilus]|uniref:Uncharacterized protein n=1 Tax=Rhodoblastus acidophilus TaxID=1074 RepID=A0A212RAN0_RHOAC|nr:hypothetical protein [Rhodoblastus acidophilus]PPQ39355.1 hypothetical protein CKO16_06265 [Rhodoblastus acidophilus]RAI22427.1 hypothetical protein CH337_05460 [Rhodoblastus acidophilus]SNB69316.1 hypothetical protein SAMN06265338_103198 [Rhodoblastus acidophilus]